MKHALRHAISPHPAERRNMVTSPCRTSAAAIYEMEKGGRRTVLSKAVNAAYKRAVELGIVLENQPPMWYAGRDPGH